MGQQPAFAFRAAGITGEGSVGAQHTMTGNDDGDGVASHGTADGAGRPTADALCQITVGHRLAVRDLQQLLPDGLPEFRASRGLSAPPKKCRPLW